MKEIIKRLKLSKKEVDFICKAHGLRKARNGDWE